MIDENDLVQLVLRSMKNEPGEWADDSPGFSAYHCRLQIRVEWSEAGVVIRFLDSRDEHTVGWFNSYRLNRSLRKRGKAHKKAVVAELAMKFAGNEANRGQR